MFVSGSTFRALESRVEELRQQVDRLAAENSVLRALAADALKLEDLAERAQRLSGAAGEAMAALNAQAGETGVARERSKVEVNTVYQAEVTGYVSAYFHGGFTDKIRLLVGPQDPPTEVMSTANTQNSINGYAGGLVRKGEFWMIESKKGSEGGFACLFTPLF